MRPEMDWWSQPVMPPARSMAAPAPSPTVSADLWGRILKARLRPATPPPVRSMATLALTMSARLLGFFFAPASSVTSYGFGTVMGGSGGVDRSSGTTPMSTVTSAAQLTADNSGDAADNDWPTRVWDFGSDTDRPVLKWITGISIDNNSTPADSSDDTYTYECDAATALRLFPTGQMCGGIIPGQGR